MTEANRSIDELPAILEERRKFEAWLAALDSRRDVASKHVFDKVRMDYEGRLRRVEEELAAHRHTIQEERASLSSRVALLAADEQLRRDERAELELRLHVGEIAGEAADSAFRTVDESLEHITSEKNDLATRIADLDRLLEPRASNTGAAESESPSADASSALMETTPVSMDPISERSSEQSSDESSEQSRVQATGRATAGSSDAVPVAATSEADATNGGAPAAESGAERDPRRTPGGTFDELAFLSDLVGDGTHSSAPVAQHDDAAAESLLAGLEDAAHRRGGEAPLGSNVPGHTPIAIRVTGAIEQVKTLKCTECGAMNYPTEWYC